MSTANALGQHISDPRALSDALATTDTYVSPTPVSSPSPPVPSDPYDPTHADMYSGLANYTFGSPRPPSPSFPYDASAETTESISPLTSVPPRLSADRTPRPSVSAQPAFPPFQNVSSHPSQGAGRPASSLRASSSQSRRHSATRDPSYSSAVNPSGSRSRAVSGSSDGERSEDPTPSSDLMISSYFSPQRGNVMSDNASHHTFGPASRIHGVTTTSSQDGEAPSSSSVSVTTSRSSSRASMHTTEQFSSDDDLEIYDAPSPVTFARDYLVDIDEEIDLNPGPSTMRSSLLDGRRGSLPMAIPNASQGGDAYSSRSREGSILTIRRPSRSWDATSARRSSHSGEDPTLVLPRSEPHSRADWHSLEAQQAPAGSVYDGLDLQYICSIRSEGSIRSLIGPGAGRPSPYIPAITLSQGSFTTLPGEDSFTRHLRYNEPEFNAIRFYWSFQREKADASSASLLRRQQAYYYRTDKSGKEMPPRVQEMWRCGHVGRFKVERLAFKPQFADPAKSAQQRIHIRHIPDPFLSNTASGPHSIIHKHSRAVAFSIFRSHALFSGRGHSSTQTHMNMRLAIMLAPKSVQEQYTSTKTVRQLVTHRLLDNESHGPRDKERRRGQDKKEDRSKGKGKSKSKTKSQSRSKDKDKSDSKHRLNPTESTESSTAASGAGGVTNSMVKHLVSVPDQPVVNIQLSPSGSSSMTVYKPDSTSRPVSPTLSLPPSISNSVKVSDSEAYAISAIRHQRDHRDSIDSEDRLPARTTHAEAFSALDPNDIESLRAKASSGRVNPDSGSTLERLLHFFRGSSSSRVDDHPSSSTQPRAFQPPWLITAGRDQQEENDRVLNDLNASFRDVGLLHTNPHKPPKVTSKRKPNHSILDQIPDDYLYMLLPLWPGENDTESIHAETSSAASFVTIPEKRRYLLAHYVPTTAADPKDKKPEKKKAKQSHSSDSGIEADGKTICLSAFHVAARVVTYDELRLSGVRIPSDGLAINGPEWEAMSYPDCIPLQDPIVICECEGREQGFHFISEGLLKLGLCIQEDYPIQDLSDPEAERREGKIVPTPIGRAAVEMIWLGCLAVTSFGSA